MTLDCPFSDEDCALINDLLQKSAELKDFFQKCRQAGVEMGPLEVQRDRDEDTLRKIKAMWFPSHS